MDVVTEARETVLDIFSALRHELPYMPKWFLRAIISPVTFSLSMSHDDWVDEAWDWGEAGIGSNKNTLVEVIPGLTEIVGQFGPLIQSFKERGFNVSSAFSILRYFFGIEAARAFEEKRLSGVLDLAEEYGRNVVYVGHSVGAIIALLSFVENYQRVKRCICLCPPIGGSRLVRLLFLGLALPICFKGIRELDHLADSFSYLAGLISDLPREAQERIIIVLGEKDRVISDFTLPDSHVRIDVLPTSHLGILDDPAVAEHIIALIEGANMQPSECY